jgi:hypothetical protein
MATIRSRVQLYSEIPLVCLFLAVFAPAISHSQELRQSSPAAANATGNVGDQTPGKQAAQPGTPSAARVEEAEEEYQDRIANYFNQQNYEQLEKEAQEARTSKARFPGGGWRLFFFYEALDAPGRNARATEDDWMHYLHLTQVWMKQRPDSITSQVADAEAYVNYAWHARGRGPADLVTDDNWQLFYSRVASARHLLEGAAKLKEKCPYWYEAMQHVALAQGWPKFKARQLFEQAITFEPSYYHYYREYAYFLEPNRHGEDGEAEGFAEETAKRVPGPEGKFLYFEIASVIACPCAGEDVSGHLQRLSWPMIKEGYASLTQLYGTSMLKRNRYAFMAVTANDLPAAQQMFTEIGENWDPGIWRDKANFERTKESVGKRGGLQMNQPTSLAGNSPE